MADSCPTKVLLVGWDAADWKVIHPLMDQGEMPALEWLVSNGTSGNLATLHPPLSPMLWTSIATGKRPYKHGVHGFTEPNPQGDGIRPVSGLARTCKAFWNILHQNGLRSMVVGWWPSHPADPVRGAMVSNHYQKAAAPIEQPWPLAPGTVYPKRLEEALADLRLHPSEIVAEQILPFVPRVVEMKRTEDPRLSMLAKILAECATIQAAATHLLREETYDLMAVYFDGIDHFSHGFMKYHPPQQSEISDDDFEVFKDVINGAYRFHDMMLRTLLSLVDTDTSVIIMSDHGFHSDELRPRDIPREPAGPAVEHRDQGILVVRGPGIKADELVYGASVLDIAPTILTLFDLPVGEDMDGQPLVGLFEQPPAVSSIPSWDAVSGEAGMHPPNQQLPAWESQQAIEQLVALGYIEKPSENAQGAIEITIRESRYNVAQAYVDAGRYGDAIPIFEKLCHKWPMEHRFGVRLASCYQAMDRTTEQREVVETMLTRRKKEAEEARERLKELNDEIRQRKLHREQSDSPHDGRATEATTDASATVDLAELRELLGDDELTEYMNLQRTAAFRPYVMHYLMGSVCYAEGNDEEALKYLRLAERADPSSVGLHNLLGAVHLRMKRWDIAKESYEKVLGFDSENPRAHLGLAQVALARRRNRQAVSHALNAIGSQYHFPIAHYHLGVGLHRIGRLDRAVEAFQVSLGQNPNLLLAHQRLLHIYQNRLHDEVRAAEHREAIAAIKRVRDESNRSDTTTTRERGAQLSDDTEPVSDTSIPQDVCIDSVDAKIDADQSEKAPVREEIIVVSGLPRSGTSMMMQMLAAGGLPVMTDGKRAADPDNPKGYYELEKVRRLRENSDWLSLARGRAVKVVAQLLQRLKDGERYRIIFMERDMDEIIASQRTMLDRNGKTGAELSDDQLKSTFVKQLDQIKKTASQRPDTELLFVDYRATIRDPVSTATAVASFLGIELDGQSMCGVVDRQLYRQRS